MSQLPAADRMQTGGSSGPEANGAFVGPVILTALAAWRARMGVLTAAVLVLALANAPTQLAQWDASERMEQASARSEARGDRSPDPEEALRDLEAIGPACCNLCGATLLGFFLVLPLTAGATCWVRGRFAATPVFRTSRADFGVTFRHLALRW
jgi:hypothetical protein